MLDHRGGVPGDLRPVERRLHQTPPPLVLGSLAGQEAVAKQLPGALERPALGEFRVLDDEHLLDEIGMVDEEHPFAADPEERDVAVVVCEAGENRKRIPARHDQCAEHRQPRPGRTGGARGHRE